MESKDIMDMINKTTFVNNSEFNNLIGESIIEELVDGQSKWKRMDKNFNMFGMVVAGASLAFSVKMFVDSKKMRDATDISKFKVDELIHAHKKNNEDNGGVHNV